MYLLFTTEELDAVCAIWNSMRFCADTQRVPIKEAEIQKYAKKVAALYKEKIALLPDHVKSSMSIGAVVVDIGKHNTARDTFEQVYRSAETV